VDAGQFDSPVAQRGLGGQFIEARRFEFRDAERASQFAERRQAARFADLDSAAARPLVRFQALPSKTTLESPNNN
ncbi:MAG: hypothetical protein NTW86_30900, partial [Candidatus Sumerlaeota bacterium]|nr:hypothetical protein [Candidatus Sumerlaeota bacterium]